MMLKKKSNPWAKAKALFAIPVAIAGIALLSIPAVSAFENEVSVGKVSEIFANDQENGSIILRVDGQGYIFLGDKPIRLNELSNVINAAELGEDAVVTVDVDIKAPKGVLAGIKDALRSTKVARLQYRTRKPDSDKALVFNEQLNVKKAEKADDSNNDESDLVDFVVKADDSNNDKSDHVYTVVDEHPDFPGGEAALMAYIKKNLKYPTLAAKNGIQGRVTLSFTVERDGSIANIEIMKSPDEILSTEAKRVVKAMPKWKPGRKEGQAVRVKYVLPITFRLQ